MGFIGKSLSLVSRVNEWWLIRIKSPCHKVVLSLIPVLICWMLWKNRNKGRFEGVNMSIAHIIKEIGDYVRCLLINSTIVQKRVDGDDVWIKDFVKSAPPMRMGVLSIIKWTAPGKDRVKLNTDGWSKGNPGLSGGGALIRNHCGSLVAALSNFYGNTSNMKAEACALLDGLQLCEIIGCCQVDIEVDSSVLVNILLKKSKCPWVIQLEIRKICEKLTKMDYSIAHIYREINMGAEFLSNVGCREMKRCVYFERKDVPRLLKGILKIDQGGIPHVRCK
ncbi:hypothetical protein LguiB_013007 [Lonicera macranthoides]